ncbi:MAG: hypothetical protein K6E50_07575 [Lachnospiraceae bacterium]|nr:hypothetical protein [Lachnospiraceae bacterium]
MNRKRIKRVIFGIILAYLVLMIVLYVTESFGSAEEGRIKTIGDAAWYLLATLTTVGYGDLTPITPFGKVIGALMMISSAGVLTFLLGLLFSLFFGRLLPRFTLWWLKRRTWHVFSSLNEQSLFLAKKLAADEPGSVCVFCNAYEGLAREIFSEKGNFVMIDAAVEQVVRRQRKSAACNVFLIGENTWDNYSQGSEFLKGTKRERIRVCCETEHAPEHVPENMVLFNRPDNTARSYWIDNPPAEEERVFVLIGSGRLARRLMERGLLINVLPDGRPLEYHLFGDWEDFRRDHYALHNALSVDEVSETSDSVLFEKEAWNASAELLSRADRIIFCSDEEEENLRLLDELFKYFPTRAAVDVCAPLEDARCRSFGDDGRILSPEMVLKDRLNQTAILLNDLYGQKTGGGCRFGELSEFHRQSNIAAADHLPTKLRLLLKGEKVDAITAENCSRAYEAYRALSPEQKVDCRRLEHKRWMRFHVMNNWEYAQKRDNSRRRHHLLVPFEDLTLKEQELDDSAWEVLGEVKNVW